MGGVQERLTEVDVIGLTSGLLGGSGGLFTVTLADDEATPFLLEMVQVYVPSSVASTIFILRTQLSSPRLVNARSMLRGSLSLVHSTTGVGWASPLILHFSCTERPAITVSLDRWVRMRGACGGGGWGWGRGWRKEERTTVIRQAPCNGDYINFQVANRRHNKDGLQPSMSCYMFPWYYIISTCGSCDLAYKTKTGSPSRSLTADHSRTRCYLLPFHSSG